MVLAVLALALVVVASPALAAAPIPGSLVAAPGYGGAPVAAMSTGGGSIVGAVEVPEPGATQIALFTRAASSGPWTATPSIAAGFQPDPQVAVSGPQAFAVWMDNSEGRSRLTVASGPLGGPLAVTDTVRVSEGVLGVPGVSPQLAVLDDGGVLLAWRDASTHGGATVRVAPVSGGGRVGRAQTAARGAGAIALAAAGNRPWLAWAAPYLALRHLRDGRQARPRSAWARPLTAAGRPTGRPVVVTRDMSQGIRLVGAPDGHVMLAWVRPPLVGDTQPSGYVREQQAFTRLVAPWPQPPRRLGTWHADGLPGLALGPAGLAFAAFREVVPSALDLASTTMIAESREGGPWSRTTTLGHPGYSHATAQPALLGTGRTIAVRSAMRHDPAAGPSYDVVAGDDVLGQTAISDGKGFATATADDHLLVVWRDPGGVLEFQDVR